MRQLVHNIVRQLTFYNFMGLRPGGGASPEIRLKHSGWRNQRILCVVAARARRAGLLVQQQCPSEGLAPVPPARSLCCFRYFRSPGNLSMMVKCCPSEVHDEKDALSFNLLRVLLDQI